MKKPLIALAVLGGSNLVAAQSSLTVFGIIDTTLQYGTGSIASRKQLGANGITAARLGFRGLEDLGGGLAAGFWLESQLFPDNGTGTGSNTNNQASGAAPAGAAQLMTFNRRSTVSFLGPFGEIRAGRDFLPQYYNIAQADPLNNTGVGASTTFTSAITGITFIRASNSVHYFTPQGLPFGLFVHAAYYLGENASNVANKDDGNGYGLRVGLANGPFTAAVATGRTRYAVGDVHQSNATVTYDARFVRVFGGLSRDKNASLHGKGWILGATAPFGPHLLKLAYSRYETDASGNPQARKLAFGYQYEMSKRTALYATIACVGNSGGLTTALNGSITAPNKSSRGMDLGIRHIF